MRVLAVLEDGENCVRTGARRWRARPNITDDTPRRMSETPTAISKNHVPNQVHAVQKMQPSTSVTTESSTPQGHAGSFRRNAATRRKRPTIVKKDAKTSIHVTSPASGCVATSRPKGTPAIPGTR